MTAKADALAFLPEEMRTFIADLGWEPYRADQIFKRLHAKMASSIDEISELSLAMRALLKQKAVIEHPVIAGRTVSREEATVKFLLRLADGKNIEAVLMHYNKRSSLCISSQVGCPLGCSFCATGAMGFSRNMTASEIVGEIYVVAKALGRRINNILYMGMGEPFYNYEAVMRSIRLLTAPEGYGLSQRQITVSTCGIVPEIKRLATEGIQIRLAVSLHAATDEVRSTIMPVNRVYPLSVLISACKEYQAGTGRRITFEYTVIPGVNDGPDQIRALAVLLKGLKYHINVIPLNPAGGGRPGLREALLFSKALDSAGLIYTLRQSRGTTVGGGCGQLAGDKTFSARQPEQDRKEDKKRWLKK
ncbi:MAG: 23S rRNA (adenine(2503)-C(2))-methyltransferase RlmN [bacterium]|jgi:23S rRNA (adenine(2503)-C(2))-methyltransferase